MAITLASTIVEYTRLQLDALESGSWITDDQLEAELYPYVEQVSTWDFQRKLAGRWVYALGPAQPGYFFLMEASHISFTEGVGASYSAHPKGWIRQTAGSEDTSQSLRATCARIDYPMAMVDLCKTAATQWARKISQVVGNGSLSADNVQSKLLEIAGIWQGLVAG